MKEGINYGIKKQKLKKGEIEKKWWNVPMKGTKEEMKGGMKEEMNKGIKEGKNE